MDSRYLTGQPPKTSETDMPFTFKSGDMFSEPVEALVNTVNCRGTMGKGIALEFKNRWTDNFNAYKRLCTRRELRPGKSFIFHNGDMLTDGPRYIINFPTKDDWRDNSKMSYIEDGLDDLVVQVRQLGIRSIAMPPLGCGNGGLNWNVVRPLIVSRLQVLDDVEIVIFDPPGYVPPAAPSAPAIRITFERALLLKAINEVQSATPDPSFIQRMVQSLQGLGVDYRLTFEDNYGDPFSPALHDALRAMEKGGLIEAYSTPVRLPVVTESGRAMIAGLLKYDADRADQLILDLRAALLADQPDAAPQA